MEISIVHLELHFDDQRRITMLEIKIKSKKDQIAGNNLLGIVSTAFFMTTFLVDEGKSLEMILDEDRKNVVDLKIALKGSDIGLEDVTNFLEAFQEAIDETEITF